MLKCSKFKWHKIKENETTNVNIENKKDDAQKHPKNIFAINVNRFIGCLRYCSMIMMGNIYTPRELLKGY